MTGIKVGLLLLIMWHPAIWVHQAQARGEGNQAVNAPVQHSARGCAGSVSCRECHERFYHLWSTSRHGLAMQAYSAGFAKAELTPQEDAIVIGEYGYLADITKGVVLEKGPKETKNYGIDYVLGGKNVYYFLTPLERGRLQTLPVAYDVNRKEWLDTAASGLRHIPGEDLGRPVNWKKWPYTFNTACYGCHVSQLSTNYDVKKDEYQTTWSEPGINCETCHGPAVEHNKIAKAAPKGEPLPDPRIISTKTMTKQERNDLCSSCHAKASPLTVEYRPKERFFDHFDLVTLENADYYPDGRDLGENYTHTSWSMSPCAKSGKIDCLHCHTSSGRYRFKQERYNDACMPCHADKMNDPAAHTHHPVDGEAGRCVSCHMPMTSFARMNRSDHSMLPPTPAATIAYESPNACTFCHKDKDASWADKYVREWRRRDYQAPVLHRAGLIEAARKRNWSRLPEMLDYITSKDHDEVFAVSLIRLIPAAKALSVQPALLTAVRDASPLVRAAAAEALGLIPSTEGLQALIEATGDEYRLVRVRAFAGLSQYPQLTVQGAYHEQIKRAKEEYLAFIMARPDQWTAHFNMGNYHLNRNQPEEAIVSYETALKFEPDEVMAMVNCSIAYARTGQNDKAEHALKKALGAAPDNAAMLFNMGLLKAEQNDLQGAETYLRKALKADAQMAQAAYNLCIITAETRLNEAVGFCRKASELSADEPKYAFSLAYYLNKKGEKDEAVNVLNAFLKKCPGYKDAQMLLHEISNR